MLYPPSGMPVSATPSQTIKPNYIDVSALTASLNYNSTGDAPFVWMDTCVSAAGGAVAGDNDFSQGSDPEDFQWATTFGVNNLDNPGGVFLGSIANTPRPYLPSTDPLGNPISIPGTDWTPWRRNFLDFLCAGGNNFQTALQRSESIESFTSSPTPADAMVWAGFGFFAY